MSHQEKVKLKEEIANAVPKDVRELLGDQMTNEDEICDQVCFDKNIKWLLTYSLCYNKETFLYWCLGICTTNTVKETPFVIHLRTNFIRTSHSYHSYRARPPR